MRTFMLGAFFNLVYGGNGDVMPALGGQRDPNNCLIGAGFTWCEATQGCIRRWETPCEDNYSDCNDCLKRQRMGENIACPIQCDNETPSCESNEDCGDSRFCRPTTMNMDGPKECVMYSREGDSCGGYTLPSYESRCHPSLECAHSKSGIRPSVPMIADAPGQCVRPCTPPSVRSEYGDCQSIRGGPIMVPELGPGPVLTDGPALNNGPICRGCPPPVPCPSPGPDCEYSPPLPDNCGCVSSCGEINCHAIDPLLPPSSPPPPPMPMPHVCSEVMCMMYCENGNQIDENGCDVCACNTFSPNIDNEQVCPIPYEACANEYVCPKVTEVTTCGTGGIQGYTTYQLSLVSNVGSNIRNIYALFGENLGDSDHPMVIPGAYQVNNVFGSNIGGVSESATRFSKNSVYDSWLTIGITDGDKENKLGAIGIDFESWDLQTPLIIENGAVFLLDPNTYNLQTGEIIIGQLTLPNQRIERVVLSVQGKLDDGVNTWKQYDIAFTISPPERNDNSVPLDCVSWYDGCNTCMSHNGVLGACTRMMCFTEDTPRCLQYDSSGH